MLQELEDGVRHLLAPGDACKYGELLSTWQARLQLIQVGRERCTHELFSICLNNCSMPVHNLYVCT